MCVDTNSIAQLTRTTVEACKVVSTAGAAVGGGVFVASGSTEVELLASEITTCSAETASTDVSAHGGGAFVALRGRFHLRVSSITNCTARSAFFSAGGGLFTLGTTVRVLETTMP